MLHRTVWDAPFASSKKKVSFKLGKEVAYVTFNCRMREKESCQLGTGVNKTLWTVHVGVVVVELINCKREGIVRNEIW